jgi:hypothetical protein
MRSSRKVKQQSGDPKDKGILEARIQPKKAVTSVCDLEKKNNNNTGDRGVEGTVPVCIALCREVHN